MDQKWSPIQVLGKYFEVYGQNSPITPEAGEKKAPFWLQIFAYFNFYFPWFDKKDPVAQCKQKIRKILVAKFFASSVDGPTTVLRGIGALLVTQHIVSDLFEFYTCNHAE